MNKYAALDLGTNTFHLLIASFDENGCLVEHYRDRHYIHLAKDGISIISEEACARAILCIEKFSKQLMLHQDLKILCSGTAALRTASNGPSLVAKMEGILGIKVNVIDGITEAKYIFEGVSLAIPELRSGNHLIMDIGGGSVEFIVIKDGHFFWSNSYPIGIAVLKRKFHETEPIARDEMMLINQFIRDHIAKLLYVCRGMTFENLIGASGSFEVLSQMLHSESDELSLEVPMDFFSDIYEGLIAQDFEQRLGRDDIPDDRAHLIVVAFQLMHFVVRHLKCRRILVSKYAMKEGMLSSINTN